MVVARARARDASGSEAARRDDISCSANAGLGRGSDATLQENLSKKYNLLQMTGVWRPSFFLAVQVRLCIVFPQTAESAGGCA